MILLEESLHQKKTPAKRGEERNKQRVCGLDQPRLSVMVLLELTATEASFRPPETDAVPT